MLFRSVAEADPVDGQLADQLSDRAHDVVQRPGIAGAVGQEHGVGLGGQQRLGVGVARVEGDSGTAGASCRQAQGARRGQDIRVRFVRFRGNKRKLAI